MSVLSSVASILMLFFISILNAVPADFWQNNIPQHNPESFGSISFIMTRSLKDGALRADLLTQLKDYFKTGAFVESGTYKGDTAFLAGLLFEEVHTVELSHELVENAVIRFKNLPTVKVYQGDSGSVFKQMLPKIASRILFYLDGHYSGGNTAKGECNTPIFSELAAIRDAKKSDSIILIDDIRLFQASLYPEKLANTAAEGYPDLNELIEALLEINPDYQLCFLADALLVFPKDDPISVSPAIRACTFHRLSAIFKECPESELINADKVIASVSGEEKNEMTVYYNVYSPYEIESGLRSYGALWYGMILIKEGQIHKGVTLIQSAARSSLRGWRADRFLN